MAFKITSPDGIRILVDPWRNDPESGAWGLWFPAEFPEIPVDIVLSTHAHFDHDAVYRAHATMVLERMAGEFALGESGLPVWLTSTCANPRAGTSGRKRPPSSGRDFVRRTIPCIWIISFRSSKPGVYVLPTGGITARSRPVSLMRHSKNVDVLIMNIDDSSHILSYEDVDAALLRYRPRVVIPGHYYTKGASSVLSTLSTAEKWGRAPAGRCALEKTGAGAESGFSGPTRRARLLLWYASCERLKHNYGRPE